MDIDDFDPIGQDGESDEEIEVTAAEVLEKLEEAWINEKFAPELLESKSDLVECMVDQMKSMVSKDKQVGVICSIPCGECEVQYIRETSRALETGCKEHQEENLQNVKKGDLVGALHKLEIDRIRYVLSSYLRTRIQKIEKNVIHVLEQEATRDTNESARLSPEEFQYAKEYSTFKFKIDDIIKGFADNMEGLFKTLCLQHMPPNMQNIDRKKSVPRPNLDSYIFLTVLEEQNQVMVDPEEDPVDLEKGAQHIMRYSAVAPLLANGCIALL